VKRKLGRVERRGVTESSGEKSPERHKPKEGAGNVNWLTPERNYGPDRCTNPQGPNLAKREAVVFRWQHRETDS